MARGRGFGEVRDLEADCVAAGILRSGDIRTAAEMRKAAWDNYLECRRTYLRHMLAERRRGR